MATISKLKPGQTVWDVQRGKMGHTTVSTIRVYAVRIIEVGDNFVIASWNSNQPQKYYDVAKWKVNKPITIPTWNGMGARLATREEIKAMKEKAVNQ